MILMSILLVSLSLAKDKPEFKLVGSYPDITWTSGSKMIFSKDDNYLFLIDMHKKRKMITILDVSDPSKPKEIKPLKPVMGKDSVVFIFELSKDKERMYLNLSDEKKIAIYDIRDVHNIKKIKEISMGQLGRLASFAVDSSDRYIYLEGRVDEKDDGIYVYDLKQDKFIAKTVIEGAYPRLVSPDGKRLFYAIRSSRNKAVGLADISDPLNIKVLYETAKRYHNNRIKFAPSAGLHDMFFSQDSSKLYIAGGQAGVIVYDLSKDKLDDIQVTSGRKVIRFMNLTYSIYNISLDSKLDRLYMVGVVDGKNLTKEKSLKNRHIKGIKGVKDGVVFWGTDIAISSNGGLIAVNSYDGGLRFFKPIKPQKKEKL